MKKLISRGKTCLTFLLCSGLVINSSSVANAKGSKKLSIIVPVKVSVTEGSSKVIKLKVKGGKYTVSKVTVGSTGIAKVSKKLKVKGVNVGITKCKVVLNCKPKKGKAYKHKFSFKINVKEKKLQPTEEVPVSTEKPIVHDTPLPVRTIIVPTSTPAPDIIYVPTVTQKPSEVIIPVDESNTPKPSDSGITTPKPTQGTVLEQEKVGNITLVNGCKSYTRNGETWIYKYKDSKNIVYFMAETGTHNLGAEVLNYEDYADYCINDYTYGDGGWSKINKSGNRSLVRVSYNSYSNYAYFLDVTKIDSSVYKSVSASTSGAVSLDTIAVGYDIRNRVHLWLKEGNFIVMDIPSGEKIDEGVYIQNFRDNGTSDFYYTALNSLDLFGRGVEKNFSYNYDENSEACVCSISRDFFNVVLSNNSIMTIKHITPVVYSGGGLLVDFLDNGVDRLDFVAKYIPDDKITVNTTQCDRDYVQGTSSIIYDDSFKIGMNGTVWLNMKHYDKKGNLTDYANQSINADVVWTSWLN